MYYAYYRVSTETQAEKGGGLETQRQNIEKYCAAHDITLAASFTDAGISGAVKDYEEDEAIHKRHALVELLSIIQDGDTVVVMNTSRLWRSDTAKIIIRRELMKRHAKVLSIENERYDLYAQNPNDRFMDGIMELMDEWERMTIALKLAKGRTAKAKNGDKPAGICPYGYTYSADKKHVEVNESEAAAVRLMFSEGQKGRSLSQIANIVTEKGYPTRRGGKWTAGSVQAILRNRFYIGDLIHDSEEKRKAPGYKPTYISGHHQAIVSKIQFGKVSSQLENRKRG